MKKVLAFVLTLALLVSCGAVLAEKGPAEEQKGAYQLINKTGEPVVSILIKDKQSDLSVSYGDENTVLGVDEVVALDFPFPAGEDGSHRLVLTYTTESGKTGQFDTLSIEEASIELLDVDAVAGATPIKFGPSIKVGTYRIVNKTGAPVQTVSIVDNQTGNSNSLVSGLAADDETVMQFTIPGSEDGNHRLTVSFTVDGKEYQFATLSIEEATIELLGVDAMTGATPIKFGPLPKN